MKKLLFFLIASNLYASEWYTATSLTVGTKSFANMPQSTELRLEQYFISDSMPELYYKAGYFHEALKIWNNDVDTAENILIGVGYNIFETNGYFIDLGASASYRFSISAQSNETAYVEYTDPTIIPFAELGLGYSFDNITLRSDILMSLIGQGEAVVVQNTTDNRESFEYDMLHVNIGVAYWW